MIVIGGMGSMTGAILGAIIVTLSARAASRCLPDVTQVGFNDIYGLPISETRYFRTDPDPDNDPPAARHPRELCRDRWPIFKRFRRADKPTGGMK